MKSNKEISNYIGLWNIQYRVLELIQFIDILLNFMRNPKKRTKVPMRVVARKYVRGYFTLDLLALFPFFFVH